MDLNTEDRQQTEIYALKSIYGHDFIECPPSKVWKGAPRLPEFIIRIRHPQSEHASNVHFDLHVKLPKTYPKLAAPLFTIQSPTLGLKPHQLSAILNAINSKVHAMKDVEMVFDAVEAGQSWLAEHVQPLSEPIGSLAAQMTRRALEEEEIRRRREEEEAEQAHELQKEREREIEEQIRVDAERQQLERERLYHARRRAMSDVTEVAAEVHDDSSTETFDEEIDWQGVQFKKIQLFQPQKECLGTVFQAQPVANDELASALQLELFTVTFDTKYYSTAQGRKKLKLLETECQRVTRVRHTNILAVLAVKLVLSNTSSPSRLLILREKRPAMTLQDVLEDCDCLREARATDYISQLLSALNAIHTADLLHRGLGLCCIGLAAGNPGEARRVKVFKIAYHTQLINMNRSEPFVPNIRDDETQIPEGWLSKDTIDSPLIYTRGRDIHAAGIILLQMLLGGDVTERFPDVNEALRNSTISPTMQQHIMNMLVPGKKSVSANSLLVSLTGLALADTIKAPSIAINASALRTPVPALISGSPPADYMMYRPATRYTSRWKEDWEELELLGRGAFGSVVKARNKIDSRMYAVKKIRLRSGQSDQKIFREVNTLSRLNHRFIVRYYTTWIELNDTDSATTSAVGSSSGTQDGSSVGTSVPGGHSHTNSFDESDPLAINWSKVQSPSNGHSFPTIHFTNSDASDSGEESDPSSSDTAGSSEEKDEVSEAPNGQLVVRGASVPTPNISKTLFIQMEYVERQTLKERIQEPFSEEEAWRLFLQIVDALVHMSSLNILHRDIKLSNIFIDGKGDCKIGDFGLATFNLDVVEPADISQVNWMDPELTLDVGTRLYIAPEVQSQKGRPRTQTKADQAKADMYSLGIVFFEMNYMFTTGSERIRVLEALRTPQIIFPADWDSHRSRQQQIITWLLQHDPAKRPSAVELSESPLLPPRVEDEHFKNTLGMIVKADSPYRQSVLTALFNQGPEPGHVFLYDADEPPEHATLNSIVHDRMAQIFRLHGAVDMEPKLLLPVFNPKEDHSQAMFLDRNGKIVSLPDNAFAPFARVAARIGLRRIKRYHIGDIYKPDLVAGHPVPSKAAIFDIISQDLLTGPSAAAAEAISIVNDCLDSFANLDKYDIHLSHTKIRDAVFTQFPLEGRDDLIKLLVQPNTPLIQKRLALAEKNLSRNIADQFEILLEGGNDVDLVVARLEKVSPLFASSIDGAIREVKNTIQFAIATGVHRPVVFKPLYMLRNPQPFFDGLCFEVVKGQSNIQRRSEVLAIGGRYDRFISRFSRMKSRPEGICAVAVQISLDKIATALAAFQSASSKTVLKDRRSYGFWSPRRCDVYVAAHPSDPESTLIDRLEVTSWLWRNNISADMMYEFGSAEHESIVEQCVSEGILYIVYPRARTSRRDQPAFKVKSVLKSTEDLLSRQELVSFLSQQIAEQKRIDASVSGAPIVAERSQNLVSMKEAGASDVQLFLPPVTVKKRRKETKSLFLSKAEELGVELKESFTQTGMPIIAVDVTSDVFEAMIKNTGWVNDEVAWKAVHAYFSTQSTYAYQIRDSVLRRKADGCKFVILFAVKREQALLVKL